MGARGDSFDLGGLALASGEGVAVDLEVELGRLHFGVELCEPSPSRVPVHLDAARTVSGWSLRLRSRVRLTGPCARCLGRADLVADLDAREVDQPGLGEDLRSPYLAGAELEVRAWARDTLALAMPARLLCREDCAGLCSVCGVDLNEAGAAHRHEAPLDPRWAKLGEFRSE